MNKQDLIRELLVRMDGMLARARQFRRDAQDDANEHVGAMESRYDTFKEESQYLAGAQTVRVAELLKGIVLLRNVLETAKRGDESQAARMGSLVVVMDDNEKTSAYLLVPAGGGERFVVDARTVRALNTESPLARALIGTEPGDLVEVSVGGSIRELEVLEVA